METENLADSLLIQATAIKKASGENLAIKFCFDKMKSQSWNNWETYQFLNKMGGYYKKAIIENKEMIKNEIEQFIDFLRKNIKEMQDYYTLIAILKRQCYILKLDGAIDKAEKSNRLALSSMHPLMSDYFLTSSELYATNADLIWLSNSSPRVKAADYLYSLLASILYKVCWEKMLDEKAVIRRKRVEEITGEKSNPSFNDNMKMWRENIESPFPFTTEREQQAVSELSSDKKISIKELSKNFIKLAFEDFPKKYWQEQQTINIDDASVGPILVNESVNDFLKIFRS